MTFTFKMSLQPVDLVGVDLTVRTNGLGASSVG